MRVQRLGAGDYHDFTYGYSGETVGQLIGLPGDEVRLTQTAWARQQGSSYLRAPGFIVNDVALDPQKFPVPAWLRARELATTLGKTEYFVTMEYQATGQIPAGLIRRACVYERGDVAARGFMRWFPLRKRGFLREME